MRPAAVAARDLSLAYGSRVALGSSSFEIPRGGITAVIGPNGSGKSTLLGAIAGLIEPASGSIDVHTVDGGGRRRISYVLQSTKVNETLPVTVREVVAMGRYANDRARGRLGPQDRAAVDDAMRRMGITHLGGMHLRELSGGQRQRVLVAQGLAQDHDILLLDEPLTGLDLPSAQAIDQVIHDETETGCTIVLTTHDLAEAEVADHVILLSGRVVASGPAESVLTVENLTSAYGPNLLHVEGERLFIDDPAHRPVAGRHVHRDHSG
jgi:manganese transport system ATP-binding protein